MKRTITVCFIMLFLCIGIGHHGKWGIRKSGDEHRKFDIRSSLISSNGGYKNTRICVIINEKSDDTDMLFREIREFHDKMNGESNQLEIYLYESREKLEIGESVGETTFMMEE